MGLQIDKNAQKSFDISNSFMSKNNSFLHFTVPSMSPVDHPIFNNYWRLKVTQRAANDFAIKDFYKA